MKLRIYRSYAWVNAVPLSQASFGGKPQYTLQATNALQYLDDASGEWKALDVVEGAKPPHPDEAKLADLSPAIPRELEEFLSRHARPDRQS